jgi:hypothetical protein
LPDTTPDEVGPVTNACLGSVAVREQEGSEGNLSEQQENTQYNTSTRRFEHRPPTTRPDTIMDYYVVTTTTSLGSVSCNMTI